jgi:hypothetical protein
MLEDHLRALPHADIVARPDLTEQWACDGELPNELDESWVIRVGSDGLTETGDQAGRRQLPIREHVALRRIQEDVPEPIAANRQSR